MTAEFVNDAALQKNISTIRYLCDSFLAELEDPQTTEILLNDDGKLWQEKLREPMRHIGFMDRYRAVSLLNCIAACLCKELTHESPILEGEFPLDGSRFAGQIPPIVKSPVFAIRKPANLIYTLDQYLSDGILSSGHRRTLAEAVKNHKNILIVGGTSSGKTTLLNAIIHEIVSLCPDERPLIAEDTGEIQCAAINHIKYHTTVNVGFSVILKTFLRMRPDRIIFGEVRDHAALDLLDSWNTGHSGGCATIHANTNNPISGLTRLRSLVSRHPHAPRCIEEVIAESVHLVVYIEKTPEGRRVRQLLEITGYSPERNEYLTKII